MDGLFLKIEMAEQRRDDAEAYADAIVGLTQNPAATLLLVEAMKEAVADAELQWREIEQSAEFKARYTKRDDACADFLREMCSKI